MPLGDKINFAVASMRKTTKTLVGVMITIGGTVQIPAVNTFITKLFSEHPRVVPAVATFLGIATLLHNPTVQAAMGIKVVQKKTEIEETSTVVSIPGTETAGVTPAATPQVAGTVSDTTSGTLTESAK